MQMPILGDPYNNFNIEALVNISREQQHMIQMLCETHNAQQQQINTLRATLQDYEDSRQKTQQKTHFHWTEEEHNRFIEGLELYGMKDAKAIARHVGSRTATQVRTHAQKYFLKVERHQKKQLRTPGTSSQGDTPSQSESPLATENNSSFTMGSALLKFTEQSPLTNEHKKLLESLIQKNNQQDQKASNPPKQIQSQHVKLSLPINVRTTTNIQHTLFPSPPVMEQNNSLHLQSIPQNNALHEQPIPQNNDPSPNFYEESPNPFSPGINLGVFQNAPDTWVDQVFDPASLFACNSEYLMWQQN